MLEDRPIAVLGASGQLARSLAETATLAKLPIVLLGRQHLDLSAEPALDTRLAEINPKATINAAAYTAVDAAETDEEAAFALNAVAPGMAASAAVRLGIPFFHISTDYVFDGRKQSPYVESDPVSPINAYGRSKLAGEQAVMAANPAAIILRTAWVFSPFGSNFVKSMLRVASERTELTVVDDQLGCPTPALDLAEAILRIIEPSSHASHPAFSGVFHATGAGETTWAGFAEEIMQISGELGGPTAEIIPITTKDYPTPARRPMNSRLDCEALYEASGIRLPHWRAGLRTCISRLLSASGSQAGH